MQLRFSEKVTEKLKKIKRTDKRLFKQISKQLLLFEQNSQHPSLRTHKLSGTMYSVWSISINRSMRMIYIFYKQGEYYFVDIGTHDEVYGK